MVVEEEGGPVEPDRRLAGARAALHGQQLVEWGADDLVLLRLDGGDDVEHLAGAGPLELGQQGIAARAAWSPRHRRPAAVEEVVGDGHHGAAVDHDLAPPGQARARPWRWPGRRGRPPGPASRRRRDPSGRPRRGGGRCARSARPPRRCARRGAGVGCRPGATRAGRGRRRSRGRDSRRATRSGELLGSLPHGSQGIEGVLEGRLLGCELGVGEGSGHAHRSLRTPSKSRANSARAKIPGHSGDSTHISEAIQGLHLLFPLLIRPDFEPLTKGT